LENKTTPNKVGPGSYNIPSPFDLKFHRKTNSTLSKSSPGNFLASRFNTPSPGHYNISDFSNFSQLTPQFSLKVSRSLFHISDTSPPTSFSKHSNWIKKLPEKEVRKKLNSEHSHECRTNYVDEFGRFLYIPPIVHTQEDIGPATYNLPEILPLPKYSIPIDQRMTHNDFPYQILSDPTLYDPKTQETKLSHQIRPSSNQTEKQDFREFHFHSDQIAINRSSPVFQSKTKRDTLPVHSDTPGSGTYYKDEDDMHYLALPGVAFNQSSFRFSSKERAGTPSPDSYNLPNSIRIKTSLSPAFYPTPFQSQHFYLSIEKENMPQILIIIKMWKF
jgi:hypothetical protein